MTVSLLRPSGIAPGPVARPTSPFTLPASDNPARFVGLADALYADQSDSDALWRIGEVVLARPRRLLTPSPPRMILGSRPPWRWSSLGHVTLPSMLKHSSLNLSFCGLKFRISPTQRPA